jgi:hypothetical protein
MLPIGEESSHYTYITMGLSALGIASQLIYGSGASFPMSLFIFPLTILDGLLLMVAAF